MTGRRATWSRSLLAASLGGVVRPRQPRARPPWDEVAHPHRRRCEQLVDDAGKLAEQPRMEGRRRRRRVPRSPLCPSDRLVLQRAGETLLGAHELRRRRACASSARACSPSARRRRASDEQSLAFQLGFAREVTGDLDGAIEEHRRLEAMGGLPPPNGYWSTTTSATSSWPSAASARPSTSIARAVALAGAKPVVRLALAVALDRDEQVDQARTELAARPRLRPRAAHARP